MRGQPLQSPGASVWLAVSLAACGDGGVVRARDGGAADAASQHDGGSADAANADAGVPSDAPHVDEDVSTADGEGAGNADAVPGADADGGNPAVTFDVVEPPPPRPAVAAPPPAPPVPAAAQAAAAGVEARVDDAPRPQQAHFAPLDLAGTALRAPGRRVDDALRFGWGGGVADFDGDGDVDVFVGGALGREPACVLRNDSTPGVPVLTRVPGWCVDVPGDAMMATALVREGGGAHALLVTVDDRVLMAASTGSDAMTLREVEVPRGRACVASAALQYDIDLDGDADVVLGCQARSSSIGLRQAPVTLLLNDEGELRWSPFDGVAFVEPVNTLALAGIDVDDDGLPDIAHVVDTFSSPRARNLTFQPGGLLRRCAPDERCAFDALPFFDDRTAWGSFMGAGWVVLADGGAGLYLADWGDNRLLDPASRGDLAQARGLALGTLPYHFSWGVIVDDFDGDRRDDLLVSRGAIASDDSPETHTHVLMLQDARGNFQRFDSGPSADARLASTGGGYARGAVKVDLDLDGRLEIMVTSLQGGVSWLQETRDARRCTLRPQPRLAVTNGWGYGLRFSGAGPWHRRDVQGQAAVGASPFVVSSERTGWLRFPSGAVVPFDCGDASVVDVAEPDWLRVSWSEDAVRVEVDAAVTDGASVSIWVESRGEGRHVPGTTAALGARDLGVYVRLGDRWIPRHFSRPVDD